MNDKRKQGWSTWILAAILILVLYVLSSGPSQSLALSGQIIASAPDSLGRVGVGIDVAYGPWWPKICAPLRWGAGQPWGDPLQRYWELFPIQVR